MPKSYYNRGEIVTIRKGALIHSRHPRRKDYVLKRNQKVEVFWFWQGYSDAFREEPATVSWAGSGGYWCSASASDIIDE